MKNPQTAIKVQTAHEVLDTLSSNELVSVLSDRAYSMSAASCEALGSHMSTVGWHKRRGDLDQLLRAAE